MYYDHLITLDNEFRYIWHGGKIISSYVFLVNRYFAFFAVSCSLASSDGGRTHTARDDQNIPVAILSFFPILTTIEVSVLSYHSCPSFVTLRPFVYRGAQRLQCLSTAAGT